MAYAGEISPNLREGGGQQSLLSTMNRFVQAVREMDETIMIPNRLKDIAPGVSPPNSNSPASSSSSGSGTGAGAAAAGAEPCQTNSNNNNSLVPLDSIPMDVMANTNLFAFYKMLNAVSTELVRGHECSDDPEGENSEYADESSKQVAAAFRHHLQGLFGLLKQLTDTAQHVSSRYHEEVGDIASTKISPFTL